MKRFMLCTGDQVQTGGQELLEAWRHNVHSWIWLDLHDEELQQETQLLSEAFELDELHIIEAQRQRHPPSLRVDKDYLCVIFKALAADSHDLNFSTLQLALFCGKRFLITRRTAESPYLDQLWHSTLTVADPHTRPEHILSLMARRMADRYGGVLLSLEERLDEIEETLLERENEGQLQELVRYNTQLRAMRRILNYHVHVLDGLQQNRVLAANEQVHHELADSFALMERFNSLADLYQNVITDLIDGYISLNGHRLNQIMKVLTIVTVIFAPLALLVGIYGMNFENMPELKSSNGYYVLLTVMGCISGGLMLLFRKMKWL